MIHYRCSFPVDFLIRLLAEQLGLETRVAWPWGCGDLVRPASSGLRWCCWWTRQTKRQEAMPWPKHGGQAVVIIEPRQNPTLWLQKVRNFSTINPRNVRARRGRLKMIDIASEWRNRLSAAQHALAAAESHCPLEREVEVLKGRVEELKEEGQRRKFGPTTALHH